MGEENGLSFQHCNTGKTHWLMFMEIVKRGIKGMHNGTDGRQKLERVCEKLERGGRRHGVTWHYILTLQHWHNPLIPYTLYQMSLCITSNKYIYYSLNKTKSNKCYPGLTSCTVSVDMQ